jgi:hypothetical protein
MAIEVSHEKNLREIIFGPLDIMGRAVAVIEKVSWCP